MGEERILADVCFVKSVSGSRPADLPPYPEIAVCGRSNAGKSSLINYLAGRHQLARTGKQPGKTRLINYFLVDNSYYLVDLPGYGYARASQQEIAAWGRMMETFFADTAALAGLVICMDIRRNPSAEDLQMGTWAVHFGVPFIVAATKADKVAKSKRANEAARIRRKMEELPGAGSVAVCPVSAAERLGGTLLAQAMAQLAAGSV